MLFKELTTNIAHSSITQMDINTTNISLAVSTALSLFLPPLELGVSKLSGDLNEKNENKCY